MAAPRIDDIWRFWDYGTVQFAENCVTGEFLEVHGPNALFGDGPFKMVHDAAGGGRRFLVEQSRGPSLRLNLRQRLALRGGEEGQVCGANADEA